MAFEYSAKVNKIIDGDTIDVTLDLGFSLYLSQRVRLAEIDAPEMRESGGKDAKEFLKILLPEGSEVTIVTYKNGKEKFGRYLAQVFIGNTDVNQTLLDSGLVERY